MVRTHQLRWILLLAIALDIVSGTSYAENGSSAGVVIMAVGKATADNGNGVRRPLQRRSDIFNKDVITTEKDSRLQIRLTDGALLSLQENSNFKIDEYRYKSPSGEHDNAAYALLKGSMRTISGAIGKANKADYKVVTPVATIGIRGTDYELVLHNNPKTGQTELYGYINDGVINVANNGGSEDFGFNQFFKVGGDNQPPQQLLNPPDFMFEGYVPPQPESVSLDGSTIFLGDSTGFNILLTDIGNRLQDIYNPAFTPFSTVSNITGQYAYTFDSTLSGGPLPTILNGPSAASVQSLVNVDFTTQTITNAAVTVTLSTNDTLTGNTQQQPYSLSDVVSKGQSMTLVGTSTISTAVAVITTPTTGTLGFQFVGSKAQGAVGAYTLTQTAVTSPISATGSAIYVKQ